MGEDSNKGKAMDFILRKQKKKKKDTLYKSPLLCVTSDKSIS